MIAGCGFGELMISALARTVADSTLVFHGYGSPLVQLALHLAKRTHAPNMVLVAGATYGINPRPPFLTPTSNDWALDRGAECALNIEELFDLGAGGPHGPHVPLGSADRPLGQCQCDHAWEQRHEA